MFANIGLTYPILVITSTTKRSFEALGGIVSKSGDTIKRLLTPADKNFDLLGKIATKFFAGKKELVLAIDDTLIKKTHSRLMQGSGQFFDTVIGRKIMAFKLLCLVVTDGDYTFPLFASFLFSKELMTEPGLSKEDLVKNMILSAMKLFHNIKLIVAADGAFATKSFLKWCIENNIAVEMRMHANRKIEYKGKNIALRDIKNLKPKGRQMARTIKAVWHGMNLYITAQRRIDKHGEETIVFQVATYDAKPAVHVKNYKKRWPIEKMNRTTKQYLGLQECFSRKIDIQMNHISSVLLAYSLAQLERKYQGLDTPEKAIRELKRKNVDTLTSHFDRLSQIFGLD